MIWMQNVRIAEQRSLKMVILHIEHSVPDFEKWKAAFDSDPVDRQKSGVQSYRISRPVDDRYHAIIDLEFTTTSQAEALLAAMQQVWNTVGGTIMQNPQWRISEVIETTTY
jgi:hypothetical protein